jgi:hypothetical protein
MTMRLTHPQRHRRHTGTATNDDTGNLVHALGAVTQHPPRRANDVVPRRGKSRPPMMIASATIERAPP